MSFAVLLEFDYYYNFLFYYFAKLKTNREITYVLLIIMSSRSLYEDHMTKEELKEYQDNYWIYNDENDEDLYISWPFKNRSPKQEKESKSLREVVHTEDVSDQLILHEPIPNNGTSSKIRRKALGRSFPKRRYKSSIEDWVSSQLAATNSHECSFRNDKTPTQTMILNTSDYVKNEVWLQISRQSL